MRNRTFAARSRICSVVLCSLVTFGLAACGSDAGSSASTAASVGSNSVVAPNVGLIDRSPGVAAGTTQGAAPAPSNTTPTSNSPPAASTTPPPKPVSTGTVTLDWTPPTENSDGSALTNLAGYTVYYGTSPDKLTESVKVSNPGLTAYTLNNLASGTWYFAVSSYSSAGVESTRSGVISAQI
jgi:hypothetical protein